MTNEKSSPLKRQIFLEVIEKNKIDFNLILNENVVNHQIFSSLNIQDDEEV